VKGKLIMAVEKGIADDILVVKEVIPPHLFSKFRKLLVTVYTDSILLPAKHYSN